MQSLLDPAIQKFIRENENADVAALALKKLPSPDWDAKTIFDQIKARQKLKTKTPEWLTHENIILPAPNVIEQASSAATARYKASLVSGENFIDLTGGSGMDSWALLNHFKTGRIIDIDPQNTQRLAHNLNILSNRPVSVECARAENAIEDMEHTDLAYIDPMRRDQRQKGRFRLEDCAPNILEMLPILHKKAKTILIKTSPMMDISKGIKALGHVKAVQVVEYQGDCKELLFIIDPAYDGNAAINAVSLDKEGTIDKTLSFTLEEEAQADASFTNPQKYLYEPNPAFQKSGAFKTLATQYNVHKLAPHTHLYTSENLNPDFPGRIFEIQDQYPANTKKTPLKKANITTRNFPLSAQELRAKLKLKDGGEDTLFACTLNGGEKTLIHARKTIAKL